MKLPFLLVLTCVCGTSAWAQSAMPVPPAAGSDTVASALETDAVREAPAHARLRDVFQTMAVKSDEPSKPYRLSSEERLRLREQLRGQFAFEAQKQ